MSKSRISRVRAWARWATTCCAILVFGTGFGQAAQFLIEPSHLQASIGDTVALTAYATGPGAVRYQWYFDDNRIPGATNPALTLTNVQLFQGGAYYVTATGPGWSVDSREAHLEVSFPTGRNPQPIEIPGDEFANPYPSVIHVSGLTGMVSKVTVSLSRTTSDGIDDTDILLVGPHGQSVVLLCNVGQGELHSDFAITFDDDGAILPEFGYVPSGRFKPQGCPLPALGGPAPPAPYGTNLAVFNGTDPNGDWSLFVLSEDNETLDGEIEAGWSLTFIGPTAEPRFLGPVTHHVRLGNATPAAPYLTWATAATNIQDAIDAAAPGDEVLVDDGVYATGQSALFGNDRFRVFVSKPLAVRSRNGASRTFIEGYNTGEVPIGGFASNLVSCVRLVSGASLFGFTLTNGGAWDSGSGVYGGGTNSLVADCVLANNRCNAEGGGAAYATLARCLFKGNEAGDEGAGAAHSVLIDCELIGNFASDGGGAYQSRLERCRVIGNQANGYAGGAYQCTALNTLFVGNTAQAGAGTLASDLVNCTVAANTCLPIFLGGEMGGAVYGGTCVNGIVYDNTDLTPAGKPNYSSGPLAPSLSFAASCTTPPWPAPRNISAAPRFVNAAAGDYHLRLDSPCIDAGTNLDGFAASDFTGLRRPLDGNRDGVARPDMGAFEFNPLFFTSITRTNGHVQLSWFDSLPEMHLQSASALDTPAWTNVPFAPGTHSTELPARTSPQFFRLMLP